MKKRFIKQRAGFTMALLLGAMCLTPPVQKLATYPTEINVPLGQRATVPIGFTATQVHSSDDRVVQANVESQTSPRGADLAVISRDLGDATVTTRLFGILPWKAVHVHVVPEDMVYLGGQSIGIRLQSKGVIVIGYQRLGPREESPAAAASVQVGDVIEEVNRHIIQTADDLRRCVNQGAGAVEVTVRRGQDRIRLSVTPETGEDGLRHLGLYVRDKTAGIGTLTFYDPVRHRFGALGHVITDADTGQPINGYGSLYAADVTGVVRGVSGKPGEKKGHFAYPQTEIGHIEKNTPFGVFGEMRNNPPHGFLRMEVPVALPGQVRDGPAEILTVLHGQQVEAFRVEIENTMHQDAPHTKSMVVHVTDSRLLHETGGIVQGMSGSPIIQDGRLVGAVTHVFLSDVTRGYGVYAEWMLKESLPENSDEFEPTNTHLAV